MPENTTHPHYHDEEIVNAETRHEESDVNVKALLWFTVAFVVFAVITHITIWLLFKFFVQLERGNTNAPLTAIAPAPDAGVPPLPRLQPFPTKTATDVIPPNRNTPETDMQDMRAAEDKVLQNYGWVDRGKGIVHIPIAQAKQLALSSNSFRVNTSASVSSGTAAPQTGTAVTPSGATAPASAAPASTPSGSTATAPTTGTQH